MILLKRILDPVSEDDGFRVFVEREWPAALPEKEAQVNFWFKNIAPSEELFKSLDAGSGRWQDFRFRYRQELKEKKPHLDELRRLENRHGTVTLLVTAQDPDQSGGRVLLEAIGGVPSHGFPTGASPRRSLIFLPTL